MWSSAAVAHLLQGLTCCAFRYGILHTLVVTSGYLSYCCLSIISNWSAHSPLTSDINKSLEDSEEKTRRNRIGSSAGFFLLRTQAVGSCSHRNLILK